MNLNVTIVGQSIAFILFVLFCMRYIWPPLIESIENRQKKISEDLLAAKNAVKNLNAAQVQAVKYIKEAKIQARIIIENTNKIKEKIIYEAKTQAKFEYNKIISEIQETIFSERKKVAEELHKQIAMLTASGVEKIIEHSISEILNNDVVDKIIATL